MDGGAWRAAVHGVAKSRTRLSDFPFTLHFHALEKEMATHSSVLAWRIPGMGEPGGLPSMGSHRVGHDWSDLAPSQKYLCFLIAPNPKESFISLNPWTSLVAQQVKNPPAMRETWVQSLGWEDSLEKGKVTHSSILAWRIPWTVQSMGLQRVGHDSATFTSLEPYTKIT